MNPIEIIEPAGLWWAWAILLPPAVVVIGWILWGDRLRRLVCRGTDWALRRGVVRGDVGPTEVVRPVGAGLQRDPEPIEQPRAIDVDQDRQTRDSIELCEILPVAPITRADQ